MGATTRAQHPLRGIRHPDAEAAAYLRAILQLVVTPLSALVSRALGPHLAAYAEAQAAARSDALRSDLVAADTIGAVRRSLGAAELAMGRRLNSPELAAAIKTAAAGTDKASLAMTTTLMARAAKEAERKVGGVVPAVDVFKDSPRLREARAAFVKENVGLIKSLSRDTFADVEKRVIGAMTDGKRHTELARELQERFGVSASRAALIAQDQCSKFNGALNAERQQAAGVQVFRWSTSMDQRVRPSHSAIEGNEYEYADPPLVDGGTAIPGRPVRCRCVAIPVVGKNPDAEKAAATASEKAARARAEFEAFMAPKRASAESASAEHAARVKAAAEAARKAAFGSKVSEGLRAHHAAKRSELEAEARGAIERAAAEAASRAAAEESARIAAAELARAAAEAEAKRLAEAEAARLKLEAELARKAEISRKISEALKATFEAKRLAKEAEAAKLAAAAKAAAEAAAKAAAEAARKAEISRKISEGLKASAAAKKAAKAGLTATTATTAPAAVAKALTPADVLSIRATGGSSGEVVLASGEVKSVVVGPLGGVRTAGLTESEFMAIRVKQLIGYGRSPAEAARMAASDWSMWGVAPPPAAGVVAAPRAALKVTAKAQAFDPARGAAELAKLTPVQREAIENVRKGGQAFKAERQRLEGEMLKKYGQAGVDWLHEQIAQVQLTVNVPAEKVPNGHTKTVMEMLTADGHSKSLFETGHGNGATNLQIRAGWERNVFGTAYEKGKPSERPVYGGFHVSGEAGGPAKQYGRRAYLVLKPEMRARATFTHGNSSGAGKGEGLTHDELLGELARAVGGDGAIRRAGTPQDLWREMQSRYSGGSYFEMQIHGRLDWTTDVAHIHLHDELPRYSPQAHAAAVAFARQHGIPVGVGRW